MKRSWIVGAALLAVAACGDDGGGDGVDAGADAMVSPAALSITPMTNDFGSVTVGDTSATSASFTVTNTGAAASGALSASLSGGGAGEFSIDSNGCTGSLGGNESCSVTVSFSPTSAGAKTANLVVSGGEPGTGVMATVTGTGIAPGRLEISPASNGFGTVVVGAVSASATFTVTNAGGSPAGAVTVALGGADVGDFEIVTDDCDGETIPAAGDCDITVRFGPSSTGAKSASLNVNSPQGNVSAALTGSGIADALLSINPTLASFGSVVVGQTSTEIALTITNIGGVATGALGATITGLSAGEFTIVNENCDGATLAPSANCNVVVRMDPTSTGAKTATLAVTGAPGGTANATLSGTAVAVGSISIDPTTHTFASTTVGANSASRTFTVTNTGGSATGALSTALAGGDPAEFQLVGGGNGCQGQILAGGASCTIAVRFSPTSGGLKEATLVVSGTPGGTATANLSGTGIPDADITISPASRDFGSLGIGAMSAYQLFTITNVGGQPTGTVGVALGGANSSEFSMVNGCSGTLAPTDSCDVMVRFEPATVGNKSAALNITATPGGPRSAALSGAGVNPAQIQFVSPPSGAFGIVNIDDTSTAQTWVVRNDGTEVTGTLNVTATGHTGDYNLSGTCQGTTLVNNATCTIIADFEPTLIGTRTLNLTVTGTPGGTLNTTLTGTGRYKIEIIDPASLMRDFGNVIVNTTSIPTQTVTVRNNTGGTLNLTRSSTPTLPNNGYSTNQTCNGSLTAGSTCTSTVSFQPTNTTNPKTLSMFWSAPGVSAASRNTVNMTGNGIDSLIISPTTHNFGPVAVGLSSAPQNFTITNPTNAPLTNPLNIFKTGAAFQITNASTCATALGANSSCTVTVVFTPSATGGATGSVSASALPAGGTVTSNLSGTGVTPANFSLSPNPLAFGNVFSEETRTLTVVMSNPAGSATTGTITRGVTGGPGFSVLTGNATDCQTGVSTLAGGATCNIRIQYAPTGNTAPSFGDVTGLLTVTANPGGGAKTVDLTATKVSQISITPTPHDYGNVNVNTTNDQTFTVRNDSGAAHVIQSSTLSSTTFTSVINNTCPGGAPGLASGAECTMVVRYAPTSSGTHNRTLTVLTSGGRAIASITGHANTAANVEWVESSYNFGSTFGGELGATKTFTLRNEGEATSGVPAIGLGGTNPASWTITNNGCTAGLAGGATCPVTVQFTPDLSTGSQNQTANLTATATPGGTASPVALSGRRMGTNGRLIITPPVAEYADTTVGQTSAPVLFTVQNSGTAARTINGFVFEQTVDGAATTHFGRSTASPGTCSTTFPFSLPAGTSCTVNVVFTPTTAASHSNFLRVDDAGFTLSDPYAALHGTGLTVANLTVTAAVAFPNTAINTSSQQVFTVTNTGQSPSGNVGVSAMAAPDATHFNRTTTCSGSLAPAGTCTVTVNFAPTTTGTKNSAFTVSATPGGSVPRSVTGLAVNPALLSISPSLAGDEYNEGSRRVNVVDPSPGSSTFTISNIAGSADTGPISFSLSNSTDFSIAAGTTCVSGTTVLAANTSCVINVRFDPQTVGSLNTTLSVTATPGGTVTGSVAGTGLTQLSSPATAALGTVAVGSAGSNVAVTFTNNANNGTATGILTTTLGGTHAGQVSIVSDTCAGAIVAPVGGANTCVVTVRLVPQGAAGARTATITVSGDPGNSSMTTLNGTVP